MSEPPAVVMAESKVSAVVPLSAAPAPPKVSSTMMIEVAEANWALVRATATNVAYVGMRLCLNMFNFILFWWFFVIIARDLFF